MAGSSGVLVRSALIVIATICIATSSGWASDQEAREQGKKQESARDVIRISEELLHRADESVTEQLTGRKIAIAADGTVVGIASTGEQPGVEVLILSDRGVERAFTLMPPPNETFNLLSFAFAEEGDLCVLGGLIKHHVFRNKELAGTFSFISRMADIRGNELLWSLEADAPPSHIKVDEDPPQLVVSDLTERTLLEEDCQVLHRVPLEGLDRDDGFSVIAQEVLAAYREDGKIWTVGRYSGSIQLLSRTGKLQQELQVSADTEPVDSEAIEAQLRGAIGTPLHDPDPDIVVLPPSRNPQIRDIAVHGRDLYLLPTTDSSDHGLLIKLEHLSDQLLFFRLPDSLHQATAIAITDDAIWFDTPLSRIDLHELAALARRATR